MSMSKEIAEDYGTLLKAIRERIRSAQYKALRSVNRELVGLYWDIGRIIVEQQRDEAWGRSVVQRLAKDLRAELPGVSGYSVSNLWYMRKLYLAYRDKEKLQPLVGEISWSHNLVILDRCKADLEREFYLRMTRRMGWTRRVLVHQIENQTYEKTLLSQTNFEETVPEPARATPSRKPLCGHERRAAPNRTPWCGHQRRAAPNRTPWCGLQRRAAPNRTSLGRATSRPRRARSLFTDRQSSSERSERPKPICQSHF